ncbi:MAG: class I SAM-dependent methyltransferase [Polyangiaceae bacterium]|nr:class I SAM-dependent methyltransferase [Polyangiaceae bacterium]
MSLREPGRQVQRYGRRARSYDRETWLINALIGRAWRRRLFDGASGRLLEVGVGTGGNFRFYPPALEAHAVDLTPAMVAVAEERASDLGTHVTLSAMDVCALDFPDASFDRVVATCVFCSVPDPVAGFRELRRVLRPGGQVRLIEHMRPESRLLGPIFDRLDGPFYRRMGFHIARRTLGAIAEAGLAVRLDRVRLFGIFHYLELENGAGSSCAVS